MVWYEAIIDAVPFPIHVIDMDMNWTMLNKAFEKLMIESGAVPDRRAAVGKPCASAAAATAVAVPRSPRATAAAP